MEKRLIVLIHPFLAYQEIKIYEGKKETLTFTSVLPELAHTIEALCDKYQIEDVVLGGMGKYAHKVADQITSCHYSTNAIKVSVIS